MTTEMSTKPVMVEIDCRIEAGNWPSITSLENVTQTTFSALTACENLSRKRTILNSSEVSLLFTNDTHIQSINAIHRDHNRPTNVLSFPQKEPDAILFGPYLGDVVLAYETLLREAALEKKEFTHHLQHLLVHGFLHLVGFDHEEEEEAIEMEGLETEILRSLGINDPYKDTTEQ